MCSTHADMDRFSRRHVWIRTDLSIYMMVVDMHTWSSDWKRVVFVIYIINHVAVPAAGLAHAFNFFLVFCLSKVFRVELSEVNRLSSHYHAGLLRACVFTESSALSARLLLWLCDLGFPMATS